MSALHSNHSNPSTTHPDSSTGREAQLLELMSTNQGRACQDIHRTIAYLKRLESRVHTDHYRALCEITEQIEMEALTFDAVHLQLQRLAANEIKASKYRGHGLGYGKRQGGP